MLKKKVPSFLLTCSIRNFDEENTCGGYNAGHVSWTIVVNNLLKWLLVILAPVVWWLKN